MHYEKGQIEALIIKSDCHSFQNRGVWITIRQNSDEIDTVEHNANKWQLSTISMAIIKQKFKLENWWVFSLARL